MATIYRADGTTETVQPKNPTEGFKIKAAQEIVGGYVEVVDLPDGRIMLINEDSKMQNLPRNSAATELSGLSPQDYIAGDVLVCNDSEFK